ncbi:vacuolar-sorting receptor 1-like [Iris pallida]|uniref:Vacuolar-sorting receptor 1-like n=1 Tax=Iris pallida TaxID=29817 RepID=A0AAX6GWG9_IRIPA|nr:vacuolar-sorting receptor 1-like [Iris pallida]KAJ6833096.1 vacuolar-sorting receptor 1-like [Iris pallida]
MKKNIRLCRPCTCPHFRLPCRLPPCPFPICTCSSGARAPSWCQKEGFQRSGLIRIGTMDHGLHHPTKGSGADGRVELRTSHPQGHLIPRAHAKDRPLVANVNLLRFVQ